MADSVGTAYLTLVPKLQKGWDAGVKSDLSKIDGAAAGKKAGNGFAAAFAPKLKAGAMAGVAAIGSAVVAVTKQAVESYAQYEQLIGGTELMYGEAADQVKKYAAEAFSTVQMSANQYLETANYYATGLKEALGGNEKAAAQLSNRIITAQADIVAATGASQEAVSNAFQGVMKNNFSMLDNLGLGINASKEGMQQVIDKMNEWNAAQGKSTNYQMGNLADMENALADYVEYVGMAGYATSEASGTIEGSVASAKAAWENWLVGLASDNADVEQLTEDLVSSVSNVVKNLAPVVGRVLVKIASMIPPALQKMLVAAVVGLGNLTYKAITKVQELGNKAKQALLDKVGEFTSAGRNIVQGIVNGIGSGAEWVKSKIQEVCSNALSTLKSFFGIKSPSRVMAQMGGYMMQGLANGIEDGERGVTNSMDSVNRKLLSRTGAPIRTSFASGVTAGGITINLNYEAGADANQMVLDIASGLRRLNALGA